MHDVRSILAKATAVVDQRGTARIGVVGGIVKSGPDVLEGYFRRDQTKRGLVTPMDFPRNDNDDAKQEATKEAQHGASFGMHVVQPVCIPPVTVLTILTPSLTTVLTLTCY